MHQVCTDAQKRLKDQLGPKIMDLLNKINEDDVTSEDAALGEVFDTVYKWSQVTGDHMNTILCLYAIQCYDNKYDKDVKHVIKASRTLGVSEVKSASKAMVRSEIKDLYTRIIVTTGRKDEFVKILLTRCTELMNVAACACISACNNVYQSSTKPLEWANGVLDDGYWAQSSQQ